MPGELDIYGANLVGLPGVGIGFTDQFAWSHTVSAGNRFTAYTLTSYRTTRRPTSSTASRADDLDRPRVEVLPARRLDHRRAAHAVVQRVRPDHQLPRTRLDDADHAHLPRRQPRQRRVRRAVHGDDGGTDFDEFVAAHRDHQGVPLFNTVAVSNDGRAWYADTSATPNLSDEAEALYTERLASDPITGIARDNGVVLLDGSDSRSAWEDVPGARDPGLVPFAEMPMVQRPDYVFNANDSFWMPHATDMLAGDYSRLHGAQATPGRCALVRTPPCCRAPDRARRRCATARSRARSCATRRSPTRPSRPGCCASRSSSAARPRRSSTCPSSSATTAPSSCRRSASTSAGACSVLAGWDGRHDLDSRGAVLWRELLSAIRRDVPGGLGALWAEPFDPARPVETPAGLLPAGPDGDPVLAALARAVQTLDQGRPCC